MRSDLEADNGTSVSSKTPRTIRSFNTDIYAASTPTAHSSHFSVFPEADIVSLKPNRKFSPVYFQRNSSNSHSNLISDISKVTSTQSTNSQNSINHQWNHDTLSLSMGIPWDGLGHRHCVSSGELPSSQSIASSDLVLEIDSLYDLGIKSCNTSDANDITSTVGVSGTSGTSATAISGIKQPLEKVVLSSPSILKRSSSDSQIFEKRFELPESSLKLQPVRLPINGAGQKQPERAYSSITDASVVGDSDYDTAESNRPIISKNSFKFVKVATRSNKRVRSDCNVDSSYELSTEKFTKTGIEGLIEDYSSKFPKYKARIVLPKLNAERSSEILKIAEGKKMQLSDVKQILALLKLRNFDIKLRLIARIVGNSRLLKDIEFVEHEKDTGLIISERPDGDLNLTIKTYAGADDSKQMFEKSIVSCFRNVKEFQIYFRKPNEPTTYKSKNNLLNARSSKRRKLEDCTIPAKCVKRPLNSFMLYRSMMVKAIILISFMDSISSYIFSKTGMSYTEYDSMRELDFLNKLSKKADDKLLLDLKSHFKIKKFNHHMLIQIVSILWKTEDASVKNEFYEAAKMEKSIHTLCYPEYKYRPNRKT
ncbi:hypothetical protein FOA43_004712 [Brettanomyces nanus]|uniref:Uncharacterized protein n=1 Tax=Eeniella nana TaxID=13502 RepID=A0A875SFD0_EENNA|nr:uncharacterized protein FOA43_004712 [Brettanomyces nanus]QPG77304.1 hypothetical protein FOA43_004712 [Brettanomyces nanus]